MFRSSSKHKKKFKMSQQILDRISGVSCLAPLQTRCGSCGPPSSQHAVRSAKHLSLSSSPSFPHKQRIEIIEGILYIAIMFPPPPPPPPPPIAYTVKLATPFLYHSLCTGERRPTLCTLHIAVDFLKSLKIAVVWGGGGGLLGYSAYIISL
jgi:hypothetical protein